MASQQANAALLRDLQRRTFNYFIKYGNADNGLVQDKSAPDSPASITSVGMALAAYPVAVERGFMDRQEAAARVLRTLAFFWNSPQGPEADATGYKGFYYHFLEMDSGRRSKDSEVSTIDSTCFFASALAASQYFDAETEDEQAIRELADGLYRRADWTWALNGGDRVTMGWTPEEGFLETRWDGYTEALLLYILGLASPTHPLPEESYAAWTESYEWRELYGIEYLHAGPLFIHQLSHVWLDLRTIQDSYMRRKELDYFLNSRRATYTQQRHAIENPHGYVGYGRFTWGITASEGPGDVTRTINGREIQFHDYESRGIPNEDDGTIAPWAVVASLPFAPEIVLPTIRHISAAYPCTVGDKGFRCSFNPTFTTGNNGQGWRSDHYHGLNQGPIVLMIENYFTGLIWRLMRRCPYIKIGLQRAGFRGGWLGEPQGQTI